MPPRGSTSCNSAGGSHGRQNSSLPDGQSESLMRSLASGGKVHRLRNNECKGHRYDGLSPRSAGRIDRAFDHVLLGSRGKVRGNDGTWKRISREEVKRRFREHQADILVCTDAAAEGLNFQFCGALVNYDMPWNPMRVEQRIGRIDRLGQRFTDIRIVNLHYAGTVEADVYVAA